MSSIDSVSPLCEESKIDMFTPPCILIPQICSLPKYDFDEEEDFDRINQTPYCSDEDNIRREEEKANNKEIRCHKRVHAILDMSPNTRSLYLRNLPFEDIAFMFSRVKCWFRVFCLKSMSDDVSNPFLHYWTKHYRVHVDSTLPQ